MAIYFLNVPKAFIHVFSQAGINPVSVTEIPLSDPLSTIIWYAKTETDIMQFKTMGVFARKIILAADSLILESPTVTSLLLRQNEIEMYLPFIAANITQVLAPEKHWFEVKSQITDSSEPQIIKQTVEKIIKIEVVTSSTIAVISGAPTGKSFIAWNIAHIFAKRNYYTSLVNIDRGYSSNILFGIDSDSESALKNLEHKDLKLIYDEGYLAEENLKIFTHDLLATEKIDSEYYLEALNYIRINSDMIIIDCKSGYDDKLKNSLISSTLNLLVFDLDNMHTRFNLQFIEQIKELLNPQKTVVIINNVFSGSNELNHLLKLIKSLNMQFKEILTIKNCGVAAYDAMYTNTCPYDISKDKEFKEDFDKLMGCLMAREKKSFLTKLFKKIRGEKIDASEVKGPF